MPFLPCHLCGSKLEKRIDKNKKPYFLCEPCGMQVFIRRKRGMDLLEEAFRNSEKAEIPFRAHAQDLYEIQALLKEIAGVKAELDKIGLSFFISDEKLRIRKSLKSKHTNLLFQLEQMAQEKPEKP
jgi:hypothetical protein